MHMVSCCRRCQTDSLEGKLDFSQEQPLDFPLCTSGPGAQVTRPPHPAKEVLQCPAEDKCGEQRLVSLPLSRIRVIMKSSPEVSSINQEALVLTAKATELFVQYLATCSYRHGSGKAKKALTYSDLASAAEDSETLQFLADILPKKILASKYLKMLKEKREEEDDDDDGSDLGEVPA